MIESTQIGPYEFQIRTSIIPEEANNRGEVNLESKVIRISPTTSATETPVTLLHELIHSVNHVFGLEDKEEVVKPLANGLAQALQSLGYLPRTIPHRKIRSDGTS